MSDYNEVWSRGALEAQVGKQVPFRGAGGEEIGTATVTGVTDDGALMIEVSLSNTGETFQTVSRP
jgi:hypothetical protein